MQPERRREAELHPERQPHHDGAQHQDHADRGAVTGIMRAQVEAADLAGVAHLQQITEQPSLARSAGSGRPAPHAGSKAAGLRHSPVQCGAITALAPHQ